MRVVVLSWLRDRANKVSSQHQAILLYVPQHVRYPKVTIETSWYKAMAMNCYYEGMVRRRDTV